MKKILFALLIHSLSYASFDYINSFEADFVQRVTDDKNTSLIYKGHVRASKPQNAVWNYRKPIQKDVYINNYEVTIVEPEIEQVIIRKIESNFNFFSMLENAKKISKNRYEAKYMDNRFIITTDGKKINSISYFDEFENFVQINFINQKLNMQIDDEIFIPVFPLEFDVIRD